MISSSRLKEVGRPHPRPPRSARQHLLPVIPQTGRRQAHLGQALRQVDERLQRVAVMALLPRPWSAPSPHWMGCDSQTARVPPPHKQSPTSSRRKKTLALQKETLAVQKFKMSNVYYFSNKGLRYIHSTAGYRVCNSSIDGNPSGGDLSVTRLLSTTHFLKLVRCAPRQ